LSVEELSQISNLVTSFIQSRIEDRKLSVKPFIKLSNFIKNLIGSVEQLIESSEDIYKNTIKYLFRINLKLLDVINLDVELLLNASNQMHLITDYLNSCLDLGLVILTNFKNFDEQLTKYSIDNLGLKLLRINTNIENNNSLVQKQVCDILNALIKDYDIQSVIIKVINEQGIMPTKKILTLISIIKLSLNLGKIDFSSSSKGIQDLNKHISAGIAYIYK
jgi:hypothetical protein